MEKYLLNRKDAADRYGMSVRGLETLYMRNPDFPIVRVGKKVLIPIEAADKWFESYIGGRVAM